MTEPHPARESSTPRLSSHGEPTGTAPHPAQNEPGSEQGRKVRSYEPVAPSPDLVAGPEDGLLRTPWAYDSPMMLRYYDTEWGMPMRHERGVFERLSLEAFQAGLSWATILAKREAFREAFVGFSPDSVAAFDDEDRARLLADAAIVRHAGKIDATITNARATVALRGRVALRSDGAEPEVAGSPVEGGGGLAELVWAYRPKKTPRPMRLSQIPTQSPESRALAKALKRQGFRFVGPTSMFALMEALGLVDTHLVGSHRRGASGVWRE